jgi:hypothetical protein
MHSFKLHFEATSGDFPLQLMAYIYRLKPMKFVLFRVKSEFMPFFQVFYCK